MKQKKLKPTGKAWVIVWVSYDYNDQFYYPSGEMGNVGLPNAVYLNKEEADKACLEENAKNFAGLDLEEYCDGDVASIFKSKKIQTDEDVNEVFKKLFGVDASPGHYRVPQEVPLKNLIELAKMVSLEFYTVVETGIYGTPKTAES